MPFAVIEKSGCGIHKGRAKLRLDFFLNPTDPNYDKYPDGPFHSHFIYPDKDAPDADIKAEIEKCLNYFYAFHQHCWDKGLEFINEWKKVPSQIGQVRCPFTKGIDKDLSANRGKVQNVLSRLQEFRITVLKVPPVNLNIGKKGTISVGSAAVDRASYVTIAGSTQVNTIVEADNPANASGILDTVEAYFYQATAGNHFRVGTFHDNGSSSLTCHEGYEIGTVVGTGYHEFTGLSLAISTGEFIGADGKAISVLLRIDAATGGTLSYFASQQAYCDTNDTGTYEQQAYIISLCGTGMESGGAIVKIVNESMALDEVVIGIMPETSTDRISISDFPIRISGFVRLIVEAVSIVETFIKYTTAGSLVKLMTDAIGVLDTQLRRVRFVKLFVETVGIVSAWVRVKMIVKFASGKRETFN